MAGGRRRAAAAVLGGALLFAVPAGAAASSLSDLIVAPTLPNFTATVPGPTNGPLTATEFASQSSDPKQAAAQFAALARVPGFASVIRLWTDRTGPGQGANDMAELLFRIPDQTKAAAFAEGLAAPFASSPATRSFAVASIPGAQAFAVQVATPVHATEQVVIFQAGQYVGMTQSASVASAANPSPITPSQTIVVAYQQYTAILAADPLDSATPRSAPTTPPPAPLGSSDTPVAAVAVVLGSAAALIAGLPWLLALWRRRHPTVDTWSPHTTLAAFGAVVPARPSSEEYPHPRLVPSLPGEPSAARQQQRGALTADR